MGHYLIFFYTAKCNKKNSKEIASTSYVEEAKGFYLIERCKPIGDAFLLRQ